jgi:hypothetical protein
MHVVTEHATGPHREDTRMATTDTRYFDYPASAPATLREIMAPANRRCWDAIAAPGTWWTGAERVAIADETRRAEDCQLCLERKAALSAAAVQGEHDSGGVLPATAVEAIHKIVTDSARLSRQWVEGLLDDGLSDAQYVEIVGVLSNVMSVDDLHRGLGLPLEPLPEPLPGEPSRHRPAGAVDEGAYVFTVPNGDALEPMDKDIYPGGYAPFIIRAMSLVPNQVRELWNVHDAHYLTHEEMGEQKGRTLSRSQIELIAARVSAVNECYY